MIESRSRPPSRRSTRWSTRGAVAGLAALVLLVPTTAGADRNSVSDIRSEREQARDAEAAALAELRLLELEDARMAEIVAEIQASVDAQQARVDGARQALEAAEQEVAAREQAAVDAEIAIVVMNEEVRRRAVDAFVGTASADTPWLDAADVNDTAVRIAYLDFTAGTDRDALDGLRSLHARREEHLEAAEQARTQADELRRVVEDELAELELRRQVQLEIQAELQDRIDEWQRRADERAREAEELTDLIRERQAAALGFAPGDPGVASVQGFVLPTSGTPGSPFGLRVHPIFRTTRMHSGVDIGGSTGDPIWASKAGRVIYAGWKGGYGNTVIVQHEGNVATLYAHQSVLQSAEGDWVEQGEVIGLVGSTGWSTGPHLHFEVRVDGAPRDPMLFLPG